MKILAFADARTSLALPDVEPDIVLLLGDIPSILLSKINRRYTCKKLGVLGNHCHPSNFDDMDILNMHNQVIEWNGMTFGGFEGSPIYKDRPFGQHSEAEAQSFIDRIGNRHIDVMLTHSNPAYGDKVLDNAHRGFESFNRLFLNKQVGMFFHGNLHDPFKKEIEGCQVYSVYPYLWLQG